MTAPEQYRPPAYVGERLAVHLRTAQRLMSSGQIRTVRVGTQLRTTDRWIDEYVERNASGGRGRTRRAGRTAAGLVLLAVLAGCGYSPWQGLESQAQKAQWECQQQYNHVGDLGDYCGNTRPS